jgi:phytanoyl-CoA hydroxylase
MGTLTQRQIEAYQRDGFLVVEDFMPSHARKDLRARAEEIVEEWEPSEERTRFTTNEQQRSANAEFLDSASGTWCFFEDEAFAADGSLRQDKALSINKIGHATHDLDPVFEAFTYTSDLAGVIQDIGPANATALQSMYIFKQPGIGGEVSCHQDATFLYSDPLTVTGFWFALEDATLDNGCLWALPGGHRTSLRKTFERSGPDAATSQAAMTFTELDAAPLPAPATLTPLPVPAGTLIVLHGLLPHWSDANRSPRSRHAYSVHCIDQAADYPAWNWLQRSPVTPLRAFATVAAGNI